jgi:cytochrome c551/c552
VISRVWNPRRLTAVSILIGAGVASAASPQSALIDQYCVACHNEKLKTAGVSLQGLDNAKVGENAAVWEKVLRKVHAGQMPPAGLPHPPAAASAEFTNWLQTELDQDAAANPNPARSEAARR